MKKFEIGKEYFDRSACNHDCIFTIKIIKRTEKTVTGRNMPTPLLIKKLTAIMPLSKKEVH